MRYLNCFFVSLYLSAAILHAQEQPSTSEKRQVSKQGTQNPEAYELYLKGRSYWAKRTRADLETAVSYFNRAIAKDPGYALAYAGLADAYAVLPDYGGTTSENIPKANAAAREALELDATLGRPMLFWATPNLSTNGILPEGKLSSRRPSHSTPTMPLHRRGTRKISARLVAGSRKPLLESTVLTNSIRCRQSSATV